ncbi:MAG: hypothetical protein ACYS0E_00490 [Planctomycetota bacterium]
MAVVLLLLLASPIETTHYQLHSELDSGRSQEFARVLEAAWPEYTRIFGRTPKLENGQRLKVRVFKDRNGWAKAIRADAGIPPGKAGGFYWPRSKTAYLFDQPTRSYTRTLLLHEAAHQFHFLACTNNKQPGAGWYTEGIAEYAAEHFWDGEKLELGVVQLVTLKDYPHNASSGIGRPHGWALVHYLAEREPKAFKRMRGKLDRGTKVKAKEPKKFRAWLKDNQEPWAQVFNEWNGVGPKSLRGFAPVMSLCRIKAPAQSLSARLRVPDNGRFRGGLLVEYKDPKDYTVVLIDQRGVLDVDRRRDGRWIKMQRFTDLKLPKDEIPLKAERGEQGVTVTVAGREFGPWDLGGKTLGLALDHSDLVFTELDWR